MSLLFLMELSLLPVWAWAEFSLPLFLFKKELGHPFHGPFLCFNFATSNCPSNLYSYWRGRFDRNSGEMHVAARLIKRNAIEIGTVGHLTRKTSFGRVQVIRSIGVKFRYQFYVRFEPNRCGSQWEYIPSSYHCAPWMRQQVGVASIDITLKMVVCSN